MESKDGTFIFHLSWADTLREYPSEVRYEVYDAIIRYVQSGTLSELKPLAKMAFSFIKKEIDSDKEKYQKVCERNRENGSRGGRPKNPSEPRKPSGFSENPKNPSKPKKPDNDYDNDYDLSPPVPPSQLSSPHDLEEKKVYGFRENVRLSDVEMTTLKMKMAENGLAETYITRLLDRLSAYKEETNKHYKSDLAALISWGIPAVLEEIKRTSQSRGNVFAQQQPPRGRDLIGNDDEFTSD